MRLAWVSLWKQNKTFSPEYTVNNLGIQIIQLGYHNYVAWTLFVRHKCIIFIQNFFKSYKLLWTVKELPLSDHWCYLILFCYVQLFVIILKCELPTQTFWVWILTSCFIRYVVIRNINFMIFDFIISKMEIL